MLDYKSEEKLVDQTKVFSKFHKGARALFRDSLGYSPAGVLTADITPESHYIELQLDSGEKIGMGYKEKPITGFRSIETAGDTSIQVKFYGEKMFFVDLL